VAEIDFADGFDVPEPLAWGLTPAQLGAIVLATVLAYLTLHLPLPAAVAVPVATILASGGLILALARHEGRTLLSWTVVAAPYWARPRHGLLVVDALTRASRETTVAGEAGVEAEVPRRLPLVLLPEPVEPPHQLAGTGDNRPRPFALLDVAEVAGGELLEVRPGFRDRCPGGGLRGPWDGEQEDHAETRAVRATRRVTFFSLGGGTGRTTLAVEVAGLLASRCRGVGTEGRAERRHVALVDLDLNSPRAGIRLGVPSATDWDLDGPGEVRAAVDRLLAVHPTGLRVLPGPSRLLPVGWSDRPDLVDGVAAAVGEIERRGCDTLVLDVRGDLDPLTRWALESAHDIFIVLTPTAGGAHDAYRSTEALRGLGLRHRLRYVVNRGRRGAVLAEAMADLGGVVVAEIPDDPELGRAEMEHRLVGVEGSGPTAAALRGLAATIDARLLTSRLGADRSGARRLLRRRAG
jgi:MinD-like ATPase involved in chromosome partitioning or flagellar assembly